MHGKKKAKKTEDDDQEEPAEEPVRKHRTRDELLDKLEALKCNDDDEFYKGVVEEGDDDGDESWDSADFSSGEE